MKNTLLFLLLLCFSLAAMAQQDGDYRSSDSVMLTEKDNWEVYQVATLSWQPATSSPANANLVAGNTITILPGHKWSNENTSIIPAGITVICKTAVFGNFSTNSANKIKLQGTFIFFAHTSNQKIIQGMITESGSTFIMRASTSVKPVPFFSSANFHNLTFDTDSTLSKPASNSSLIGPTPGQDWAINGLLTVKGWLVDFYHKDNTRGTINGDILITGDSSILGLKNTTIAAGKTLTIEAGNVLTIGGASGQNATLQIAGSLINKSEKAIQINATGALAFNDGGKYVHDITTSTIPGSKTTYSPGSTIEVTGVTNNIPALPLTVGNVVWNSPAQTATNIFLRSPAQGGETISTFEGDFTIISTGSGNIYQKGSSSTRTLNIAGNLVLLGGNYKIVNPNGEGEQQLSVAGDVVISGGTFTICEASNVQAKASLNIGGSLLHTGGYIRDGNKARHASTISFTGDGNISLSTTGFTNAVDIVINKNTGSVQLAEHLDINAAAHIKVEKGTLNLNGKTINLLANETSTAMVASVTGAIDQTTPDSKFITNIVIPAGKRAYRQIAPGVNTTENIWHNWQNAGVNTPGKGTFITGSKTGASGFDQTQTGAASLYTYQAGSPVYTPVPGTDGNNNLYALQGYRMFIIGDRNADLTIANNTGIGRPNISLNSSTTLSAAGAIIAGDVTYNSTHAVNGSNSLPAARLTDVANGFSLIANPYWSAVDFDALEKNDVSNTFWIWDPSIGNRGAYVTYNTASGASGGKITRHIQPGQAIFVQTTGASPSITFSEAHKSDTLKNTFRINQSLSKMSVQLFTQRQPGLHLQDGAMVVFSNDFSKAVSNEDAVKMTNSDENIAIINKASVLSIDGRDFPSTADTIPLRLWSLYSNNNYILQLTPTDFDPSMNAVLVDKYVGKQYLIDAYAGLQLPFSFTADSASFYNRFMLVFNSAGVLPIGEIKIKATPKDEKVVVEWTTYNEMNIAHYEVERSGDAISYIPVGKVTATGNSLASQYSFVDLHAVQGTNYYRIKAVGKLGDITYSAVVRIHNNLKEKVSIHPNPVPAKQFKIELSGLDGQYQVSIVDQQGKNVLVQNLQAATVVSSYSITLPASIAAGQYTVVVRGSNGVVASRPIIIQ